MASDTLVFQSYRTTGVEPWMETCLGGVKAWALAAGFQYCFLDDAFLEAVPQWFRDRSTRSLLPITDVGRLIWAQRFLNKGIKTVVWIDADVVIFDPQGFRLPSGRKFYLTREVAVREQGGDEIGVSIRVNNSVSVYGQGNSFLPFYLDSCLATAEAAKGGLDRLALGTILLTKLGDTVPLPLLPDVGCFPTSIMADLANGFGRWPAVYRKACGGPLHAANLCHSFSEGSGEAGASFPQKGFELAVEALLASGGRVVNDARP